MYFNWSTGKDSALALYHILQNPSFEVSRLLTSINAHFDRVSMHGLRRELMENQIKSIGIPFSTVELPESPDMAEYETIMENTVKQLVRDGYKNCAFGDIFLEDLRRYREEQLAQFDIKAHFPLWKRDTKTIINEFLDLGFKAIVICAKAELLDESYVGRVIDKDFIDSLPSTVDPCGENGEFHTFCFDGPLFKTPIPFEIGETVFKSYKNPAKCETDTENEPGLAKDMGFWYCDLIPVN